MSKLKKRYFILGPIHGGTSFIAKSIKEIGIPLNHDGPQKDFVYEPFSLSILNDHVIKLAGGDKWTVAPFEKILAIMNHPFFKTKFERIFNSLLKKHEVALKDPRFSQILPAYFHHFDQDEQIIQITRIPHKNARSNLLDENPYDKNKEFIQYRTGRVKKMIKKSIKTVKAFIELGKIDTFSPHVKTDRQIARDDYETWESKSEINQ